MEHVEYIQKNNNYDTFCLNSFLKFVVVFITKRKWREREKKKNPNQPIKQTKKPEQKHNCGVAKALTACFLPQGPDVGVEDS